MELHLVNQRFLIQTKPKSSYHWVSHPIQENWLSLWNQLQIRIPWRMMQTSFRKNMEETNQIPMTVKGKVKVRLTKFMKISIFKLSCTEYLSQWLVYSSEDATSQEAKLLEDDADDNACESQASSQAGMLSCTCLRFYYPPSLKTMM